MNERGYTSTTHVAAALGVSTTTVKRWVDEGVLPAQRTAGGHRRIRVADVLRLARAGNFPLLDIDRLALPRQGKTAAEPATLRGQFLAALKAGDGWTSRLLVQQAYRGGLAPEELADAVVAPVMADIGAEWQGGCLDVLYEHRATQTCASALYALKAELEQDTRADSPLAVGGCPEGDPYLLANLLAELVLLAAGWEVINLGPHTPLGSFRQALSEFRPQLLWLSVSHVENLDGFAREYRLLYRDAERQGTAVAIGGRALTDDVRGGLPYTTYGDRLAHFAAFARSLVSRG